MCDSTPIGELCETRVAMMKSDTETFTNGHGENQEVANNDKTAAVQNGNAVSG